MKNFLESLIENNRQYVEHGKLASYIPELEKANKEDLGIYIVTLDGKEVGAGEYDKKVYYSEYIKSNNFNACNIR